jgi:hypothetical protein
MTDSALIARSASEKSTREMNAVDRLFAFIGQKFF